MLVQAGANINHKHEYWIKNLIEICLTHKSPHAGVIRFLIEREFELTRVKTVDRERVLKILMEDRILVLQMMHNREGIISETNLGLLPTGIFREIIKYA